MIRLFILALILTLTVVPAVEAGHRSVRSVRVYSNGSVTVRGYSAGPGYRNRSTSRSTSRCANGRCR